MNRKRLLVIGFIALALAFAVSMLMYRILRQSLSTAKPDSTVVVAAAVDLPVGSSINEADLKLVKLPSGDLPSGSFRSISEVTGRGVVIPIVKNEPVLSSSLAAANGGAGLPSLIPEGMRAVSVKVNDVVSVAGFTVPGTRVDVLLTGTLDRNNDPGQYSTTTVLENVQVLAAGQSLERTTDGKAKDVPVITLLVSPEQAQKLTLAMNEGRIQLSLRNPLDLGEKKPPLLKNAALYNGGEAPPRPHVRTAKKEAPAPPPPVMVELIQGTKRNEVKF